MVQILICDWTLNDTRVRAIDFLHSGKSIHSFTVLYLRFHTCIFWLPWWLRSKNPPANTGDAGDMSSIPGVERSPGGGHGNPLEYSCLENPIDKGVWWAGKSHNMTECMHALCTLIYYHLTILSSHLSSFYSLEILCELLSRDMTWYKQKFRGK